MGGGEAKLKEGRVRGIGFCFDNIEERFKDSHANVYNRQIYQNQKNP